MSQQTLRPVSSVAQTMHKAHALLAEGQTVSAELVLRQLVEKRPEVVEAWLLLADLAEARGDDARARECLAQATKREPDDVALILTVANKQLNMNQPAACIDTLAALLERAPHTVLAWFMLGDALEAGDQHDLAARARNQGVHRGQAAGQLISMETTPVLLQPIIHQVIAEINQQRRSRIDGALERMRAKFSATELARVEHAVKVYLEEVKDGPASAHQKPGFLFFPGLPQGPFHEVALQSWSAKLSAAFETIRTEVLAALRKQDGLDKDLAKPSWDTFLVRQGVRDEANLKRFPKTAAVLNSLELCDVAGQGPEVCISVMQPGARTLPHQGLTNTRLMLQLPLQAAGDCALHVHGGAERTYQQGEALMFDDTFRHESWNRSEQPRVLLQLDCWNPHLSDAERVALRDIIGSLNAYEHFPQDQLGQIAQQMRAQAPA
jgi:aspartate beta-hydroxylase